MSVSFLAAATERASGAGSDGSVPALTALMAGAALTGGGLVDAPGFWQKEAGAPLLRRNAGFLTRAGIPDELRRRFATWPALCGVSSGAAVAAGVCDDEAAFRIFLRDAERTFQDEGHRQAFMDLLKRVWPENRDYHQGLGYVCSLLMLVFDSATTQAMLLQLTRAPKYTPGYWRAAPEPYVRDAMVYARLLQEREPKVAKLLHAACIVPEAYASKWFIGLCVHVLPFQALPMAMPPTPTSSPDPSPTHDPSPNPNPGPSLNPNPHPHPHPSPGPEQALFDFVEGFLKEGYLFLFKFSLAIVAATKAPL